MGIIWYYLLRLLGFLTAIVPVRLSYAVASLLGDAAYFFWSSKGKIAVDSMRRVLGPGSQADEAKALARRAFRNYAKSLVDFFRFPQLTVHELEVLIAQSFGWEHLESVLRGGKGVILVAPHFGSWDFAGAILGLRGYLIHAVADVFKSDRANELVQRSRLARGIDIIPFGGALKKLYQALRRGEIVGLVVDRPLAGSGVAVRFFGEEAYLPAGPAALALKTGAGIILGYCVRHPQDDRRFMGGFLPPIKFAPTGNRERDIQALTQKIAEILEMIIRLYPDQWYPFHNIWARGNQEIGNRGIRQSPVPDSMIPDSLIS
jgi:lauroyl/myristoyl acyltransferase